MKLLLSGYYGHRNLGDDLLLRIVLARVADRDGIREIGVTCNPSTGEYIRAWMPTVRLVDPAIAVHNAYRGFDRVLFGGGGTIFEYRAAVPWTHVVRKNLSVLRSYGRAHIRGTRFASVGLGIGPFGSERARRVACCSLRYHDVIFVRDQKSANFARLATRADVRVAPDLSLAEYTSCMRVPRQTGKIRNVAIIARHYRYGENSNGYLTEVMRLARHLSNTGCRVEWMSFQPEYDSPIIAELRKTGYAVWEWDPARMNFTDVYARIADAFAVITTRMHGIFIAGMLGVPVVGIGLHPKLEYAAELFPGYATTVSAQPTFEDLLQALSLVTRAGADVPRDALTRSANHVEEMFETVLDWAM